MNTMETPHNRLSRSRKKMVIAVIMFALLLSCTLTLGRPYATGAIVIKGENVVSFRIWNPTLFPVSWSYLLFDGSGKPVSDEYQSAFEDAAKPILRFGTITQKLKLACPLPKGDYMLKVLFRYDVWGSQHEKASILQFKS